MLRARARAAGAATFYDRGIARIDDRWPGTGATGERFRDAKHVYADDLDLFGKGCLFELFSQARLPMGEECLARWLTAPSPIPAIHERHSVIAELREKLDLREALALIGEDLRVRLDPRSLIAWAESPALLPGGASGVIVRLLGGLLSLCAALAICYFFFTAKLAPMLVVLVVEGAVLRWLRPRAMRVVSGMAANAEGLELFSKILERLEQEPFTSPRLQAFAAELKSGGESASQAIRRLARVVYWIDARAGCSPNHGAAVSLHGADGDGRRSVAPPVGRPDARLDGSYRELEALLSLAAYSFEHPDDPFPEFVAREPNAPAFCRRATGHPLIPAAACVRNDVRLDAATRVLLVSGSNMSGKSTYLRTAGINAVLAMAGAPIRGSRCGSLPFRSGRASAAVDSLQEIRSSFYTEILRIKDVFELTDGAAPVLFFRRFARRHEFERPQNWRGWICCTRLLERGAIGIVTTHDLALTEMTSALLGQRPQRAFSGLRRRGQDALRLQVRDGVVARKQRARIDALDRVGGVAAARSRGSVRVIDLRPCRRSE